MHQSTVEPTPTTTATADFVVSPPSGIVSRPSQDNQGSSTSSAHSSLHKATSPTSALGPYLPHNVSTTLATKSASTAPKSTSTAPESTSTALVASSTALVRASQFDKRVFKVIVIGNASVGKTTLTYRFCEGKFLESPEATIGVDFRTRVVNIDGEDITLQLWDTAGQERFRQSMVRHYYKNTHAVVFVYDVTNAESFDGLKRWIQESYEHGLGYLNLPKILIGNKCDGASVVTTNVAQRFADQYDMPLFETSARLDSQCDNVESIFMTLAYKLKNNKTFNQPIGAICGNNQPGEEKKFKLQEPKNTKQQKGCC